ncbi:MAG: hypothetical protein LBJ43_01655 [Propionibacteriaceae bacterium]|jgi:hypothetical protein|nr:hypothetical protein [Propionibacteriaceae bacterium]
MSEQIPKTGNETVDAALAQLADVAELTTAEKLERLTQAQQTLAEMLESTRET